MKTIDALRKRYLQKEFQTFVLSNIYVRHSSENYEMTYVMIYVLKLDPCSDWEHCLVFSWMLEIETRELRLEIDKYYGVAIKMESPQTQMLIKLLQESNGYNRSLTETLPE
jgi:hypothetical protein